jgi:gliding motility-associated-like protein
MRKILLLAFSLVVAAVSVNTAKACHAIALVNPQQQMFATYVNVTASSDSPTCGCSTYWLDVEVRCNNPSDPFTGGPLSPGVWVPYNSYPFFQSAQMNKPNCVVQQYPWVSISFAGLCPGVSYKYRMRENHNGQVGPWTTTFTFTVPGVQSPLQVTATASPTSICGAQTVQLNSSITGGCSSNKTISWSPSTGLSSSTVANPTAVVSSTTTYTVTYQDLCSNQSATASVTITVAPPPVAGTASAAPNPICAGQTTTLTLSGSTGNVQWQSSGSSLGPWTNIAGATSTTYTTPALSATTYYQAVVSNACGSVTSNVVTVTVNPSPNVTLTAAPTSICVGQSSTLTASGASSYTWGHTSSTSATQTVSPTTTTVYTVTGTTSNCSTTVSVTVTVNSTPNVTATASPSSICVGSSSTLTATGASTYVWSTGANTASTTVTPPATTTYTVTGTSASGCTDTAMVTVAVGPPPTTTVTASQTSICVGQSTTLTASGAPNYNWQPGSLTGSIITVSPSVTTTYTVTGYSVPSCSTTATITITVNPLPVVSASASPAAICAGQSATLSGNGASTYDWLPGPMSGQTVTVTPSATTTYTVTGYSAAGCSATANVTVTVNPLPVVTATASPASVCPGQSTTLTGGGASTYDWLPGPMSGASVTVTPSATTTYTVTGYSAAGCSAIANVTVTLNAGPTIVATASPDSICVGASSTLSANGANTYLWQPGNLTGATVTVTPSVTTTYSVTGTTSAGCQGNTTVTVVVSPIPVVTASASPASICMGSSSTLTGGGAATYQWMPGSLSGTSVTVTPAATTVYTVTGTSAAGCSATANVTVTVNPAPVVTISASPDSICTGASSTLTATGGTQYDWMPGMMSGASVTVSPGSTTTYTVSVTTSAGCSVEDSITVFVAPPITLNTSVSDVLCFGGTTGTAAVTISGGVGTPSISWNSVPSQNTATATGLAAGTYGVTVTDALGCTATASATVNEPPQLTVAVAGIDATCFGACNGQLIVIPGGGTPPYNIVWSNGCNQPSCNNVCAGTYTVTVTDANGCTATGTATVNEPPQLAVTLFSSTSNCNQPDGEAWINVSGGTPNYAITWSPTSQTGDTAFALTPGWYVATVTDFNGCVIVDSVQVPNTPGVQASIASSINATCNGSCDGEATASGTGGTGPYTYSWNTSPVQTTATATGLCAGTYIVTITDFNGCTSTASVTITEPAIVVANPATPPTICIGQSVTLTSTATGGSGGYSYTWSGGATVSPTVTTTYNVIANDVNGCPSAPVNVTVTVNPPLDVIATGTNDICPGGSTPLQATGSGGDGNISYLWLPSSGLSSSTNPNPSASPSVTTTYTVYVSDGCGTPIDSATVTVTVNPLPVVVIGSNVTSACEPGAPNSACIDFTDQSTIASGSINGWSWDFGDGNTSATQNPTNCYDEDGIYPVTLTATSDQGCVATVAVPYPITIHPSPVPEFVFGPQPTTIVNPEICFTDMSVGAAAWSWDFADPADVDPTSTEQNPCHMYSDSGTFCVELIVTTANGCVDSITHCVIIQPDYTIYIPNAFSPNGDNMNDTFFPQGIGLNEKTFEMFIFDRWGNLIYYTTDMNKGWDGKANQGNQVAQQDVYVWKINVSDILGAKHQFLGHVTLVR